MEEGTASTVSDPRPCGCHRYECLSDKTRDLHVASFIVSCKFFFLNVFWAQTQPQPFHTRRLSLCALLTHVHVLWLYSRPFFPVGYPGSQTHAHTNFACEVTHRVWDLSSTCETRSVSSKGEEQPAGTSQAAGENCIFGRASVKKGSGEVAVGESLGLR